MYLSIYIIVIYTHTQYPHQNGKIPAIGQAAGSLMASGVRFGKVSSRFSIKTRDFEHVGWKKKRASAHFTQGKIHLLLGLRRSTSRMKPNGTKVYPKATGQSLWVDSAGFGGTALHSLNEAKHAQEIEEKSQGIQSEENYQNSLPKPPATSSDTRHSTYGNLKSPPSQGPPKGDPPSKKISRCWWLRSPETQTSLGQG